jgi:ABC-type Fe2+-enterobactin transport system substrate-binding protein
VALALGRRGHFFAHSRRQIKTRVCCATISSSDVLAVEAMEDEKTPDHSNVHHMKRPKRLVSRTRIVMGLLLIVAIPIFISLANKAVHENAEAIRQGFGR